MINLDIDENELIKALGQQIVKELNRVFKEMSNDPRLKDDIGLLIQNQIKNTPEYESLLNGGLSAIFGLIDSTKALDRIIDTVKNSIEISIQPAKFSAGLITGGITVSLLKEDLSDILALPEGSYESEGGQVDWLKWLLTAGDRIVISDFDVEFGSIPESRTNEAFMKRSSKGFRVPPEFSGTLGNNWLTRAFDGAEELIGNILLVDINRRLA